MINIGCILYGYKLFVIQTMLFNNKTPKEAAREIFEFYTKESIKINAFYSYAAWALRFINFSCLIPFLLLFAGIYLVYLSQNTHLINYFFIIFCIGYFVVFFLLAQFIYVVANPILNAIEWTIIYNCLQNKSIPTKFFSNELGQRLTSAP